MSLIAGHVWRPMASLKKRERIGNGCAFMSCGRPAAEHERVVAGKYKSWLRAA